MSKHPQRRPLTNRMQRRVEYELAVFRKTEVISDWLAKKIAKYDWVRYEAFPAMQPPVPEYRFTFGLPTWHGTFGSMNP